MDSIINTRMLAHPLNWAIVWFVALALFYAWGHLHHGMKGAMAAGSSVSAP